MSRRLRSQVARMAERVTPPQAAPCPTCGLSATSPRMTVDEALHMIEAYDNRRVDGGAALAAMIDPAETCPECGLWIGNNPRRWEVSK